MVDYNTYVYGLLNKMNASTATAPVEIVYERYREKVASPCVAYIEINNSSVMTGDTNEVSDVIYQVKVWGDTAQEVGEICAKVDTNMRGGGFKRTLAQTLVEPTTNQLYKVLQYEALGYE